MNDKLLHNLSDSEILTLTLIGEARGEPIEGIVAVGSTIRNRLHFTPSRYKNYRDVCLEPFQFSCWNSSDVNSGLLDDLAAKLINSQPLSDPYIRQCILVANGIIDWSLIDNTAGSQYYMTTSLFDSAKRPSWANKPKFELIRGKQTFFNV